MLSLVIVVSVFLIIAVIFTAYRVTTLIDVIKKENKKDDVPSGNNFQAVLLMIFMFVGIIGFLYYSIVAYDTYNLPIASAHGVITENLFWSTMAITVFVFIVTHIFLFGFAWKYRYKSSKKAHYYPHNNKIEVIWTIVPALVLAGLIISGLKQWNKLTGPPPENSEIVEIMGYQYAWAYRYPGKDGKLGKYDFRKIDAVNSMGIDFENQDGYDDFMTLQLVLPKDRPVLLKIRGRDVIHSVYNPHFRIQMNAVPGMPTHFWFTPTVSTVEMRELTGNPDFNYELVCNKICGKNHYGMKGVITVIENDEYDIWYKENQENTFLKQNPSYLSQVPESLKEVAKIAMGVESIQYEQKITTATSSLK